MGRHYTEDNTNVYRQKVTRKGHSLPHPKYPDAFSGDYETVTFYGPYRTRNVGGDPWMNADDQTMTVEVQKLGSVGDELMWLTEKSKVIEREED
jgi:hypothetical protein